MPLIYLGSGLSLEYLFGLIKIILDLSLLSSMIVSMHHCSTVFIPLVKANLLSDIKAISSANTIAVTPGMLFNYTTKLSMTILKKNGDVLFP